MVLSICYPKSESPKEIVVTSSITGALLYLLLIIYQPFGTSQFDHPYKYLLLFPYALIITISFCAINFILVKTPRKWTIGCELLKVFLILFLTSILSYFYNALFLSKVSLSFENYGYMVLYTFALGLPIAPIYIMARYIYLNTKNQEPLTQTGNESTSLETTAFLHADTGRLLEIEADYGSSCLDIMAEDFIYAEAVDNYCIIHFIKNGMASKQIIRISLSKLLYQIETDTIKRVHRSYLVNLKKIINYKGNASGYKIHLQNVSKELMISRNYVTSISPLVKSFANHP